MTFDCPRCLDSVEERFYGPCSQCRVELGAAKFEYVHDPNFERGTRMDGSECTNYVGPMRWTQDEEAT